MKTKAKTTAQTTAQTTIKTQKAICKFKGVKPKLTVGDVFELHCEWPFSVMLSSPVRIEFTPPAGEGDVPGQAPNLAPNPVPTAVTNPYSLVALRVEDIFPGKGVFKVTGYVPGQYHTGFKLVSDEGVVEVSPLSWKVESVIPPEKTESIKPYPPYGPYQSALPVWHYPACAVGLLSLLVFAFLKIRELVKRKKKRSEAQDRLKNKTAFREFTGQLNLLLRKTATSEAHSIMPELKNIFCLFLENEFFIFAVGKKSRKILRQLKKYCPYARHALKDIEKLFAEMQKLLDEKNMSDTDYEQILDMARDTAITCIQRGYARKA